MIADFTDDPLCKKCGKDLIKVEYSPIRKSGYGRFKETIEEIPEYLQCRCQRCGFTWKMKCKDSNER